MTLIQNHKAFLRASQTTSEKIENWPINPVSYIRVPDFLRTQDAQKCNECNEDHDITRFCGESDQRVSYGMLTPQTKNLAQALLSEKPKTPNEVVRIVDKNLNASPVERSKNDIQNKMTVIDELDVSQSNSIAAKNRLNSLASGTNDSITKTVEYGTQGSVSRFIKDELENYEIEESL